MQMGRSGFALLLRYLHRVHFDTAHSLQIFVNFVEYLEFVLTYALYSHRSTTSTAYFRLNIYMELVIYTLQIPPIAAGVCAHTRPINESNY